MTGIVVGVDSSQASQRALDWSLVEAEAHHEPLHVVLAVDPVPPYVTYYAVAAMVSDEEILTEARKTAQEMVDKAIADHGTTPTVEITVEAALGQPAHVLVEKSHNARLLVVGTRGAGGFGRLLLGSVSSAVVHHAVCPVTVVPAPHH